jgi:hypothetical protein
MAIQFSELELLESILELLELFWSSQTSKSSSIAQYPMPSFSVEELELLEELSKLDELELYELKLLWLEKLMLIELELVELPSLYPTIKSTPIVPTPMGFPISTELEELSVELLELLGLDNDELEELLFKSSS